MDKELRDKISRKLCDIGQLPTLPSVYSKLSAVIRDPKSSAMDVSAVIEKDQSLTTKILKVVNSAFYGFPEKVSTVSHAAVILGFNEIRNVALSVSIISAFGKGSGSGRFDYDGFWNHALAVGVCSNIAARKTGIAMLVNSGECFVAGLIHDLGKVVLDQFMSGEYAKTIDAAAAGNIPLIEAESEVLGFTHQEIGSLLMAKWNMPAHFQDVVGYHNTPLVRKGSARSFPFVSAVHLGDVLVRAMNLGNGGDPFVPALVPECWQALGLDVGHVEIIMEESVRACAEVMQMGLGDK